MDLLLSGLVGFSLPWLLLLLIEVRKKQRHNPSQAPEPSALWHKWGSKQPAMRIAIAYWIGARNILWHAPETRPCVERVSALLDRMADNMVAISRLQEVRDKILYERGVREFARFQGHLDASNKVLDEQVRAQLIQIREVYHKLLELESHRDRLQVTEVEQALSVQNLQVEVQEELSKDLAEAEEELIREIESATGRSS